MRITSFMIYDQMSRAMQNASDELGEISDRMTSGKKILKPSDDPAGASACMDYRLSITLNTSYKSNITTLQNQFEYTDIVLSTASEALSNLKQLATTTKTGSASSSEMAAYAIQAAQYRDQLLGLGNSSYNGAYIFSGYLTGAKAFDTATYAYQGDDGVINIRTDRESQTALNIPGSALFSKTLSAASSIQLTDGTYVHYTPGAGTTTDVEIRDTDDTTVLDTFSYDNFIQMADLLSTAISNGDTRRISALEQPFSDAVDQFLSAQAEMASRHEAVNTQADTIDAINLDLEDALAKTEDADMTETIMDFQKATVALEAMQQASAKILAQSLLDFLS